MTENSAPALDASAGDLEQSVLAAAEQAFARVMTGVPDQVETMPPELEVADVLRWAGDRLTELLAGFAELPLDRLVGLADRGATESDHDHGHHRARAAAEVIPGPVGEPLSVRGVRGSTAQVRVWLHTVGEVAQVRLHIVLASLVAPDGAVWPGPDAIFEPAELTVPAPVGASTLLTLRIPANTLSGSHHGLVIARGVAGAVVPITVVVTEGPP